MAKNDYTVIGIIGLIIVVAFLWQGGYLNQLFAVYYSPTCNFITNAEGTYGQGTWVAVDTNGDGILEGYDYSSSSGVISSCTSGGRTLLNIQTPEGYQVVRTDCSGCAKRPAVCVPSGTGFVFKGYSSLSDVAELTCPAAEPTCTDGTTSCEGNQLVECVGTEWGTPKPKAKGVCGVECLSTSDCDRFESCVSDKCIFEQTNANEWLISQTDLNTISISELTTRINSLQLTATQQGQLIAQIQSQLTLTTNQLSTLISGLQTTATAQGQLISQLQLTTTNQAALISKLQTDVTSQATLINQLQVTTNQQAILISTLQTSASSQAELIKALQLTSTEQASVINALNLKTSELETLINGLDLTATQQGQLISQLQISSAEQAALISGLQTTLTSQGQLISAMQSDLNEKANIITDLDLNVQEQADLIDAMELSTSDLITLVSEMQGNIDELKTELNITQSDIESIKLQLNQTQTSTNETTEEPIVTPAFDWNDFLNKNKVWLIIGGVVLIFVVLLLPRR